MKVAPREIVDVVYRAARVGGLDAGSAAELGDAAAYAEIHFGEGLLMATEALEANVGSSRPVQARRALLAAEGRLEQETTIDLPAGTNTADVAAFVDDLAKRGIAVDLEAGAMRRGEVEVVDRSERAAEALSDGVAVDPDVWSRLEAAAAPYLVAESALDAAG